MDQSVAQAFRRHQQWTAAELAVLADASKTALEKALGLRRTFNGMMAKAVGEGAYLKAP